MKPSLFFHLFECPSCHNELKFQEDKLICDHCPKTFPVRQGIPIFLEEDQIKDFAVTSHQRKSNPLKSLLRFLKPPHHSVYLDTLTDSHREGKTLIEFLKTFPENSTVVNIGSLSKKIEGAKARILNLDISWYPNIDIIADAHSLPFKNESLDGIIIKNVFEHLRDPATVRDQLQRVVKKGGRIYAKIPFLQPFHAVPDDYQRFTINGIKEFFKEFKVLEEGIAVGPSSALAWFLQEYWGILFSFNTNRGYKIARTIFSYITAPIKYLDIFFKNKKEAHRLASAFYVILEK